MFKNPDIIFDQINEGAPYLVGVPARAAYTADDFRVQISSTAPTEVSAKRASPGLFGEQYCLEIQTTIQKTSRSDGDGDNLEVWVEPDDMRAYKWGTPYAEPMTTSFDVQAAFAGDYAVSFAPSNHTTHCINRFTIPGDGVTLSRASVTFPPCYSGDWSNGGKFIINLGTGDSWTRDPSTIGQWQVSSGWSFAGAQNLTMQPVGAFLRFGRFQADVGLVAKEYRRVPVYEQQRSCERVLFKTLPQGVAVRRDAPAGYHGSLGFFGEPGAAAGVLCDRRFPVDMTLAPSVYTFSPGLKYDSHWFRANGSFCSGPASIVDVSQKGVLIANSVVGDPNGSSYYLHVVASSQRGGNGWLTQLP